jgi:diadenosine tetraphosphate (Ap4A) HIT family hydrolase
VTADRRLKPSPFLDPVRWIGQNDLAIAVRDIYPVSLGHTLIIPRRVISDVFDLTDEEIQACWKLLVSERARLDAEFKPGGYNIGINAGSIAGQTVGHVHIHLIPRYEGDHPQPRGGVRSVIPGKADY